MTDLRQRPSRIGAARRGLKRALEGVPGLRVIDHAPDAWSDFPVAVVAFERIRANVTLSGSEIAGEITVTLMTGGANPREALTDLEPLIESVDAALSADASLGGAVHYVALDRIENIGMRKLGSQRCGAAEMHFRFMAG